VDYDSLSEVMFVGLEFDALLLLPGNGKSKEEGISGWRRYIDADQNRGAWGSIS